MDINQNQQINTFIRGMDTDTSDALISNQQYRIAKNLRLTTNTNSDDGELHIIEGVSSVSFTDFFKDIIATDSIGDTGIIIGVKSDEVGWSIYTFDKNIEQTSGLNRVFGPCSTQLNRPLSLVTRCENNHNKLYIASENMSILSIDLNHTDTPVPTDISYLGINDKIFAKPIELTILNGNGQFKGPVIQYAYRFYKLGGQSTQTSPLSNIISLNKSTKEGYLSTDFIQNSIKIEINTTDIPTFVDYIQIFRITYVENGQQPIIDIAFDEPINIDPVTGKSEFIDIGRSVKTISVPEFISATNIQLKPQLIESKNNYLFAANVQYDQDYIDNLFSGSTLTYNIITDTYKIDTNNNIIEGNYGRSLRRGESYRYGVVFYTKDGKRTSVQCITDVIDIPEGNPIQSITTDTNTVYEIDRIGIEFTVTIPNDAKSKCAGYEIVRCERTFNDSTNISQGIVGDCMGSGNNLIISPFMSLYNYSYRTIYGEGNHAIHYSVNPNAVMYGCPEYVYDTDNFKDEIKSVKNILSLKNVCKYTINSEEQTENSNQVTIVGGGVRFVDDQMRPDLSPRISTHHNTVSGINRNVDLSLIYPVQKINGYNDIELSVYDMDFVESPEYDGFSDGDDILIQKDTAIVGRYNITNWFAPDFYSEGEFNDSDDVKNKFKGSDFGNYYIASGKKAILFSLDDIETEITYTGGGSSSGGGHDYGGTIESVSTTNQETEGFLNITVANLKKSQNNKYGGNSESAKKNCLFYSFGNYKDMPASGEDTLEIFDGDCYIACFEYNSAHCWDSSVYDSNKCPTVYYVPLESSIDLLKTSGDLYSKMHHTDRSWFQDVPVNIVKEYFTYIQKKSAYLYNDIYNVIPNVITYSPVTYTKISTNVYPNRIYYSEKKQDGESIDSWYQFKAANYIDTDSSFGEITNIRLFKNNLIFWQEHATGLLSVNEKTVIQDQNSTNIILGTGDILQRYDYITTLYGMKKDERCDTQSNASLYWIDSFYKQLIQYRGNGQIELLNKKKNISNYINKTNIINPKLVWDSKNNEILFSLFRDYSANGDSVVYSEIVDAFTSIYDIPFEHTISFPERLFFIENNKIYDTRNNYHPNKVINTHNNPIYPYIQYVVNKDYTYVKTFDIQTFGGRFYGGDGYTTKEENQQIVYDGGLQFDYKTPLKQHSYSDYRDVVTDREYDFRLNIPRNMPRNQTQDWGDRMRGKTIQCEIKSTTNDSDFSLQYVITKFRMSWT